MSVTLKKALRPLILICIGGLIYVCIELAFRGHSHWTMFILGGLCFYLIGLINEVIPYNTPIWLQAIIGGIIITVLEFITGCIVNLALGWNVWDYSKMPLNILGQICLPFSLAWCVLSVIAIFLDDWLRQVLFNAEKPKYSWKFNK